MDKLNKQELARLIGSLEAYAKIAKPESQWMPKTVFALLDELERAAERNVALGAELEQYRKDSERMNTAIMFAANALATVTSSDGSGHADLAESALRMAGIPADEREQLVTEWKAKSQWRIDAEMAKEGGANG